MDFEDSPEEAAFRAEARAWLEKNAKRREKSGRGLGLFEEPGDETKMIQEAKAWQARKADGGWACLTWPTAYGGRGGTPIQSVIWGQEESKFEVPPNIFAIGIGMAGPTIMTHGTEEQKQKYLKPMARGDEIWCQLFSEPGAGSDLAALRTKAERQGDDWIVNGQKVWTSGAHYSRYGILVTRTDFTAHKHKGLTYFIVDMKSPGIEIRPIKQMTGGANFNEVFFTDVRIPDANRLDEVGKGWQVAITTLMNERMTIGGGGMGAGFGLADLMGYVSSCTAYDGHSAIEDSHVRQRLADLICRLRGLELTGNRLVTALSQGKMPGPEGSIMKLAMGILLQELGAFGMDISCANGALYGEDAPLRALWQSIYLGSPAIRIAGGADEVQRNIISERVLGLPTEIRVDKSVPFSEVPTGPRAAA